MDISQLDAWLTRCLQVVAQLEVSSYEGDTAVAYLRDRIVEFQNTVTTLPLQNFFLQDQLITPSIIITRWPHQDYVQAVLGEILLPRKYRSYDRISHIAGYGVNGTRLLLAAAIHYHHPLACYHLTEALSSIDVPGAEVPGLQQALRARCQQYFQQAFLNGNAYSKALASWYLNNVAAATLLRSTISTYRETRLTPYYLHTLEGQALPVAEKLQLAQSIADLGARYIMLAELADNDAAVIIYNYAAGQAGAPEGYLNAAARLKQVGPGKANDALAQVDLEVRRLWGRHFTEVEISNLLYQAGRGGIGPAYVFLALMGKSPFETLQEGVRVTQYEETWCELAKEYQRRGDQGNADNAFSRGGVCGYRTLVEQGKSAAANTAQQFLIWQRQKLVGLAE